MWQSSYMFRRISVIFRKVLAEGNYNNACLCDRCAFFPLALQPPVGQGLLTIEASRSLLDTPHSVGFLWTSDQPYAETSDSTHYSRETGTLSTGGIRTRNPSQRMAPDPCLRPRGHWDRQRCAVVSSKHKYIINIFTGNKKRNTECLS